MDDALDDEAILARIRERLRNDTRGTAARAAPSASAPTPDDVDADMTTLRSAADIYALPFRSQRRALAAGLLLSNRLLRKLLKPSLERQVTYNAANERLVRALLGEVELLKSAQAALTQRCDALEAQVATLRDTKQGG